MRCRHSQGTKQKKQVEQEYQMKKLLIEAVRNAVSALSDRMSALRLRAMNAMERGQELRFAFLMRKIDELADELVVVCDAGSALGMSKEELRPSVGGGVS